MPFLHCSSMRDLTTVKFTLCVFNDSNNDNKKAKAQNYKSNVQLNSERGTEGTALHGGECVFLCLQKSSVGGFKKFQWWS